ncbi:electron transport complex subunit RsxC [Christensenellaceae bacterium OttesenSCG-928-M15]|nr:electron transport complex subunit RsxC [Christensenellaceae bacterium OttesenSCG-928-M15]
MPNHTFRGGVHPMHRSHEGKRPTAELPVREYVSDAVTIPMGMHLGPPSNPCVKKGDYVKVGQVIGEPVGFLGIPVHASISGEVTEVANRPYLTAQPVMCVSIKNDFKDEWVEDIKPLGDVEKVDPSLVIPAVKQAGICGMGGASFPTHVKLSIPEGKTCDTIILNGAECETFLTADDRLMREHSKKIVDGLRAVMRALNVKTGIIAIENNKPSAIAAMQKAAEGREGVSVMPLKTKYPQGGEKQLIQSVVGREVPSGKLPIEVNTIVLNVGTAAAIADAVVNGKPLISRITTVTGCVKKPSNLLLRIGTIAADVIGECEGYSEEPGKVVFGGGMTGICAPNDNIPMTKATNGIVVYNEKDAKSLEEGPCIRCGRCVSACPMGLNPYLLKHYCDNDELEQAKAYNVMDCTVCGSCSYACPAQRWLTASFKNAKDKITLAAKRGKA